MSSDLLIKISADASNAKKAFDDVKDQTEDLENQLAQVATISGIAFAAFTAEIYLADAAFRDAQKSAIQLSNALQNQGIYTRQLEADYKSYANVVQEQTGIDNDAVIAAQAVAQTFLGQRKITQELTSAIADLGAFMGGDLNSAAEKIARTIGTGTNAFARQGLVIADGATEAERYAKVLEFVRVKADGLAAEMAKADGNVQRLKTAFGNAQEAIGERFAPILALARGLLSKFFEAFDKYPIVADLATAAIAAGIAVSGLVLALALAVPAFTTLTAAAAAFGVSVNVAFAGIPLILGAVVGAITLLAVNWGEQVNGMKSDLMGLTTFAEEAFGGLSKIIAGAIDGFNTDKMAEGVDQIKNSYSKAMDLADEYYDHLEQGRLADDTKQDAEKKAAADKEAARLAQHQANLRNIKVQENALLKLQNENASEELIALKTKEIETLKAQDEETNANTRALLTERLEIIRAFQLQKETEELEREKIFAGILLETKAELAAQGIEVEAALSDQRLAMLQAKAQTEADIERQLQEEIIKKRIESNNRKLLDAKKYGESYAAINKVLQSDEVQGAKSATDELVKLQSSKSQELKAIGKAAALAQIAIGTAESAMNIYRGFSTIPIVGPALGIAGALAAVAFGGERAGDVIRAADGGLIEGGIAGRDSVPALLMPGELVVPRKSFSEVVGAVQGGGAGANPELLDALKSIDKKLDQPRQVTFNGDILSDESYIDRLINQISDGLEHRNGRIFGVNT